MQTKDHIQKLIAKALESLDIEFQESGLDHPTELSHGDYASSVALVLGKKLGQNPKELAFAIVEKIFPDDIIERVEVAGPGFVNFYLSGEFFKESVAQVDKDFGRTRLYNGKSILVEHSSPNLFKPFHIGHVMNNAVGESVTRLAEFSGAKVIKVSYPSDVSLGIGKAVWALLEHGTSELERLSTLSEKLTFLGDCYVEGTKALDENPSLERRIREITEMIYEQTPGVEYDAYLLGKGINLEYFQTITRRLGSEFDDFIYESEAGVVGKKIVTEHIGKVFKESDNAVIYEGEQDGLHTRVFINAEGYPTYEAKDIGLLWIKSKRYTPDISVQITDHEQKEYFKVVLASASKISETKEIASKTIHKTHGRMSFKGQKMSSRLGGVPIAADVIDVVVSEAQEKMKDVGNKSSADAIAIGALKFTILRAMAGKNINFDPETSLSFEGDSGPYLQYTNARINSILEKAKAVGLEPSTQKRSAGVVEVEKYLYRFPEVVELSISEWAPHYIATYLLELARAFNSWYGNTKLVDPQNENASYNLAVAKATGFTIKNGLYLLGISAPEKM